MGLAQDGDLRLEERFALDDHLAACAACRREFAATQRLGEALEVLPQPPLERIDVERALERIRNELDAQQDERVAEPRWEAPRDGRRRIVAIAAAASIMLVAGFLLHDMRPEDRTGSTTTALAEQTVEPISFETAEHEVVVGAVRDALLRFHGRESDRAAAVELFEREMRPARRAGWPILRFVERSFAREASETEPSLALAAARYLGERGDAHSAGVLERALEDDELRPEALLALGRLGEVALPALFRAVEAVEHPVGALSVMVGIGGESVADKLEELVLQKERGEALALSRPALLDGLSQLGPAAVPRLLRLAAWSREGRAEVLSRLPLIQGGGDELARLLNQKRIAASEVVYSALAILRPPPALAWLRERCEETRERERALVCLAAWSGPDPCAAVLRLHVDGRVDRDELNHVLREIAERDEESLYEFTESLIAREAATDASVWLELLFATDHVGATTSMALLSLATLLHPDDRQWAALGVGELGARAGARALIAGFRHIEAKERRLRAACLMSIHSLLGETGVHEAVGVSSPRGMGGLLASLDQVDRRARTAYGVHRVARALDKCFDESLFSRKSQPPLPLP